MTGWHEHLLIPTLFWLLSGGSTMRCSPTLKKDPNWYTLCFITEEGQLLACLFVIVMKRWHQGGLMCNDSSENRGSKSFCVVILLQACSCCGAVNPPGTACNKSRMRKRNCECQQPHSCGTLQGTRALEALDKTLGWRETADCHLHVGAQMGI